jgi:type I restriction enzyme S subunit
VSDVVIDGAIADLNYGGTSITVQLGEGGPTPYLPLAEVAPLVRRVITPQPDVAYTELGVRSFNKGTFHRRTVKGAEFTWQELYLVRKDDLVFSNIMAWEGAVALASEADDGCIGNHRMLTCACDETRVNPAFLAHYFKTPEGMAKLVSASTGTVARNRTLTATALGKMTVPVPPLAVQDRIVRHLNLLAGKTSEIERHLDAVERDADHLLALRFRDAIAQAPLRPMAQVAPLVRRAVAIAPDSKYTELGVRSFFKGIFHRRTVPGSDFSWQDIYCVRSGDLIFSNIMAWEQAIAIASPEDDGCVGNHRMLTCEANAEVVVASFLWYYFTTEEGFAKIFAASPGTAARNRTMTGPSLMAVEVPTPSLSVQQTFARLQIEITALKAKHSAIRTANAKLLPATLERVLRSTEQGTFHGH